METGLAIPAIAADGSAAYGRTESKSGDDELVEAGGNTGPVRLGKTVPAVSRGQRWSAPAELWADIPGFDNDRLTSESNTGSGHIEWYFQSREGIMGPYPSRSFAKTMLIQYLARCRKQENTRAR